MKIQKLLVCLAVPFLLTACTEDSAAVGIGEWAKAGDYQVKVIRIANTTTINKTTFKTQNNYMCILVELFNGSSISHSFSYYDFTVYKGSNKYDSKGTEAWWYAEEKGDYPSVYLSDSVGSSLSGKYYLVFETPTRSTSEEYELRYSYGFSTAKINLKQ